MNIFKKWRFQNEIKKVENSCILIAKSAINYSSDGIYCESIGVVKAIYNIDAHDFFGSRYDEVVEKKFRVLGEVFRFRSNYDNHGTGTRRIFFLDKICTRPGFIEKLIYIDLHKLMGVRRPQRYEFDYKLLRFLEAHASRDSDRR